MRGQPFVISAPSGAGKSSVIKALRGRVDGLGYSVSHTTRKPRKGEAHGTDYYFVSEENEIKKQWFTENQSVGICGATSTPHWLMDKIAKKILEL